MSEFWHSKFIFFFIFPILFISLNIIWETIHVLFLYMFKFLHFLLNLNFSAIFSCIRSKTWGADAVLVGSWVRNIILSMVQMYFLTQLCIADGKAAPQFSWWWCTKPNTLQHHGIRFYVLCNTNLSLVDLLAWDETSHVIDKVIDSMTWFVIITIRYVANNYGIRVGD